MNPAQTSRQLSLAALLFASMFPFVSFSQIKKDKLNVTMELTLPSGVANPAFKSYMNGLVSAQPKLQYKFAGDWFVAAGPKYSFYTVSYSYLSDVSANDSVPIATKRGGGANTFGAFLELGWAKWQTPRLGIEFGLKGGMTQTFYQTGLLRASGIKQRITAPFVEPTFSLVLAADEAVAYRWIVGYNMTMYKFTPSLLGLQTSGGYKPDQLNSFTQSFIVGFGMSYYFGNQRSDVYIDDNHSLD